jgi:starch phosphorylase
VQAVGRLTDEHLRSLTADREWLAALEAEAGDLAHSTGVELRPEVAYFSPEFALTELMPQYSGGLGVLAGDHLKAAHDASLALAGVGLFYHRGFFRQSIAGDGQEERYERHDAAEFGCRDTGLVVDVPMPSGVVLARVWRLDVGRVPLLLLDTDVPGNDADDVVICDRLYGADRALRARQELVLGVGGMRALDALGWDPEVVHLNEGHAGFAILEMIDRRIRDGEGLDAARKGTAKRVVFTTHTPVPAGIEKYERTIVEPYLGIWANRWGTGVDAVLGLGEDPDAGLDVFNMTALCLRHSRAANGVSRLHGEVSRSLFSGIANGDAIGSVTNGVHARSWAHPAVQALFDRHLGPDWDRGNEASWSPAGAIDDEAVRAVRRQCRSPLVDIVAERTGHRLDQDALIVGFARRFAPYKRADLLLRDTDRLVELLHDADRPVRLIYAGKAHPADDHGKRILAEILAFTRRDDVAGRMIFVPGYDMAVGRAMVAGSDVWLNTPIRPREASGTSGEKAVLNGVLNCSIRDGWWAEMCDEKGGWAIPASTAPDPSTRDDEEASATLGLLAEIATEFHGPGVTDRIRHAWMNLGPRVTAARMLVDYQQRVYWPGPGSE